jgi:dTDP-4-dehydrorhamnose 3,5-epimerase
MESAVLLYNPVFVDERGTFAPLAITFGDDKLEILRKPWLQSNISVNPKKYTLRGLHYQLEPYAQTKLVKVITGKILDFVLDLRPDSKDFGKTFFFNVAPNNELYVPKGFAHGFITLEDNTVVQYLVDNEYSQTNERSIKWDTVPDVVKYFEKNSLTDIYIIISKKDLDGKDYTHQE